MLQLLNPSPLLIVGGGALGRLVLTFVGVFIGFRRTKPDQSWPLCLSQGVMIISTLMYIVLLILLMVSSLPLLLLAPPCDRDGADGMKRRQGLRQSRRNHLRTSFCAGVSAGLSSSLIIEPSPPCAQ
jgi:hypothetical protein